MNEYIMRDKNVILPLLSIARLSPYYTFRTGDRRWCAGLSSFGFDQSSGLSVRGSGSDRVSGHSRNVFINKFQKVKIDQLPSTNTD